VRSKVKAWRELHVPELEEDPKPWADLSDEMAHEPSVSKKQMKRRLQKERLEREKQEMASRQVVTQVVTKNSFGCLGEKRA
jgi:hypothetical protein